MNFLILNPILLSIKPEFAAKIKSGEKIFEYRRKIPKKIFDRIIIYESHPIKKITAICELEQIYFEELNSLFELTKDRNGSIEKEYFDNYFKGLDKGYALRLKNIKIFKNPIDPRKIKSNFSPPQNFMYYGMLEDELRILNQN